MLRLLKKPILALEDHHALGRLIHAISEDAAVAARRSGWRKRLAGLLGRSVSDIDKARRFYQEYRPEEVPGLTALGVSWKLLTDTFAVPDKAARLTYLRAAKEKGWSGPDLQFAIQGVNRSRRGGGRPPSQPTGHGVVPDVAEVRRRVDRCGTYLSDIWTARRGRTRPRSQPCRPPPGPSWRPTWSERRRASRCSSSGVPGPSPWPGPSGPAGRALRPRSIGPVRSPRPSAGAIDAVQHGQGEDGRPAGPPTPRRGGRTGVLPGSR